MKWIQRSLDGYPIKELCPMLCCALVIDPALITDRSVFMQLRNSIEHFRDCICQDKDASIVVKVACIYAGGLKKEQLRFASPAEFRYGVPSDIDKDDIDLNDCVEQIEWGILEELKKIRQAHRVALKPIIAVVSPKPEPDLIAPRVPQIYWLFNTERSSQSHSLRVFFDRFATNVVLSMNEAI